MWFDRDPIVTAGPGMAHDGSVMRLVAILCTYDAHLTLSRTFETIMRLVVALVVACSPSAAPAPSVTAPPATTTPATKFTTVESTVQPAGSILVEMTNYAFKPSDLSLARAKVVLYLVNPSNEVHSMQLRNPSVSVTAVVASSADVEAGHSAIFTIENLPAGTYRVTCPITNHAIQGMVGSATVP